MSGSRISVVTPTLRRPAEVEGLIENLGRQTLLPFELILVDGAPEEERKTEEVVRKLEGSQPFRIVYVRHSRGTAIQRNAGIDKATGDFVAFIDDDVRLESTFFESIIKAFVSDKSGKVGGVVGYRTNTHFKIDDAQRWRWYRRLNLLTTFEPGHYDFKCGYPINANLQPPFGGTRHVQFMTTSCAVWRAGVFADGLRFDRFFVDYGVLEDAHFSLRASRKWDLLQCGDAHCEELHSANGRVDRRRVGYKYVVNYYFVFQDIVRPLTWLHKFRFWRYQTFELVRIGASALRRRQWDDCAELQGRLRGFVDVARGVISQKAQAQ